MLSLPPLPVSSPPLLVSVAHLLFRAFRLVSIKASQVENLEIGNGQLKQEVEDLKQEVEVMTAYSLENLSSSSCTGQVIAQLRAEMEEKEEQMARLLEALQNVRSDLVETVQQTLEVMIGLWQLMT